ncbi:myosin-binding protein 7-like [Zingiber officinale]|nr:myosin-binding protein 7-like [Zingiber officinale]
MDLQIVNDVALPALPCPCTCPFCCRPSTGSFRRSVKRRLFEEDTAVTASASSFGTDVVSARVEVGNEVAALREAVARQQQAIQELCAELDEERSAAASAASEAMSMIIRLQREKAETQMEARQFKRFAEEKMDHDQQEMLILEDHLFKRDEFIDSITLQLQVYQEHLSSYGVDLETIDAGVSFTHAGSAVQAPQFDGLPTFGYPHLKCTTPNDIEGEDVYETADRQKHEFGKTPNAKEVLENLEQRICELEDKDINEELPGQSGHFWESSTDRHASGSGKNSQEIRNGEEFSASTGTPSDDGGAFDNPSDRVYTIDAVHGNQMVGVAEDCENAPNVEEKIPQMNGEVVGNPDIEKLCMRLQALEVDRESMRQAIVSMRTEKAQLLLLREIAQQLSKEAPPERRMLKKKASAANSTFLSFLKLIWAFFLWKRKASRVRHTFGSSNNNVGLMLLLDKTPGISHWRRVARTHA